MAQRLGHSRSSVVAVRIEATQKEEKELELELEYDGLCVRRHGRGHGYHNLLEGHGQARGGARAPLSGGGGAAQAGAAAAAQGAQVAGELAHLGMTAFVMHTVFRLCSGMIACAKHTVFRLCSGMVAFVMHTVFRLCSVARPYCEGVCVLIRRGC